MKSRCNELLDKSIAAMISAIEIYNKPDFRYREETFSVLAINSWELLFKAKWLKENNNRINSLYVYEPKIKKDGTKSKKLIIKQTRSGNPFTHSLDWLAKKVIERNLLDEIVWLNIQALLEIRDSSIHFYNRDDLFSIRLQEVGTATLKNYIALIFDWFRKDLSQYNFYLMPLSFMAFRPDANAITFSKEETNFINYVEKLEDREAHNNDKFSITVNIDIKFTRSKAKDALAVRITKDENATPIKLTDEQIREKFPWTYDQLTEECRKRYKDFKVAKKYHNLRRELLVEQKLCKTRRLDPNNPKSSKKDFYSSNILQEFDNHYKRK